MVAVHDRVDPYLRRVRRLAHLLGRALVVLGPALDFLEASLPRQGKLVADAQVAQKKYDNAINIYTELSRDTNAQMPVDGVLMQLGRACMKAGRKEEAVRAFTRVKDEFPESMYAEEARTGIEEAKKS